MKKLITASIFATFCLFMSSCNEKNLNFNNTTNNFVKKNQKTIEGIVQFNSFKTKATESDITNETTVSLSYPNNYKVPKLRGGVVSTGLTDSTGKFTLALSNYFAPQKDDFFILEATKRIGNNNISLRTHIYFDGDNFKSITKNRIYINSKTTALSLISMLDATSLPIEQTIEKFDLNDTSTQVNQVSNNITLEKINKVKDMVDNLITQNKDPLGNIAFVDGNYIFYDNLKSKVFSGCIGNNPNCLSKIPSVKPYVNNGYELLKEFDVTNQDIDYISYGNISVDSNDKGFVVAYSKPNNTLESALKFPQNAYYNETINSYYKTYEIFAQKFDLDGNKIGNELKVSNTPAYSNDYYVKMYKNGTFKIVWNSCDSFLSQVDSNSVYNKRYNYIIGTNYPILALNSDHNRFYQDDCKTPIAHIKTYTFSNNAETEKVIHKELPLSVSENGNINIPFYYDLSTVSDYNHGNSAHIYNQFYQVFDKDNNSLSEKKDLFSKYTKDNFYYASQVASKMYSGFYTLRPTNIKIKSIFDNDSNMYVVWYQNNIINLRKYDSKMNLIYQSNLDIQYLSKNISPKNDDAIPYEEAIDILNFTLSPDGKNLLVVWRDIKNIYTSTITNGSSFSKVNSFPLYTDNQDFYSEQTDYQAKNLTVYCDYYDSFYSYYDSPQYSYYFYDNPISQYNVSFLHTSKNKFVIEQEPVVPFIDNKGNYGFMYAESKKLPYSDDLSKKNYDRTVGIIKYDRLGNEYKDKIELKTSISYTNYRYYFPHDEKYIKPTISYLPNGNMLILYQDLSITGKDLEKGRIKAKIYKFDN